MTPHFFSNFLATLIGLRRGKAPLFDRLLAGDGCTAVLHDEPAVLLGVDDALRYLEYLRLSYQTFLLPPYHANLTSTVVKTPKVYWLDVGLLRQLTGMHEVVTGEIFESMVVGECVKWIRTMGRDTELYFYRTRSGLEVDLLVEIPSGVIGVEIKSRQSAAAKDVTALKEIASTLGNRWKGGLVVHAGTELRPIADPQIWAVPSYRLFT